MTPIASNVEQKPVIARNVFFCDDGASIMVCYLESHEMCVFHTLVLVAVVISTIVVTSF